MNKAFRPSASPGTGHVDFSRSSVARYIQLATLFRQRIESGSWAERDRLPTVAQLAQEFGVARVTIRQALLLLSREGLIESHRAKGTFVVERPGADLWCQVETDWEGLSRATKDTNIKLLSMEADARPSRLPDGAAQPAPSYRRFKRLHSRGGVPFLLGDIYLDEVVYRRIPRKLFNTLGSPQLLARVPGLQITDARQILTISTADVETAELLDIPLNAPLARIYRTATSADGTLVWFGEALYRGDLVRLDLKLR